MLRIHLNEKFDCLFCGSEINNKSLILKIQAYQKHIRTLHHSKYVKKLRIMCPFFECRLDHKSIGNFNNLILHIRQIHYNQRKSSKEYNCENSGCLKNSSFSSKSSLNRHIKEQHQGVRRIQNYTQLKPSGMHFCNYSKCREENKSYKTKKSLNEHIRRRHLGLSAVICKIDNCNTKFSKSSSMNQHIKKFHYKLQRVTCNLEDCKDSDTTCLDKHKRAIYISTVHQKATQVKCKNCRVTLSHKDKLTRHLRRGSCNYSTIIWMRWERICYLIAELLFGQENKDWFWQKSYYYSKNGYIKPDISFNTGNNGQQILNIIDAKVSRGGIMDKDITIYPSIGDKLEFWILHGNTSHNTLFKIVSSTHLKEIAQNKILTRSTIKQKNRVEFIINAIDMLKKGKDPYSDPVLLKLID